MKKSAFTIITFTSLLFLLQPLILQAQQDTMNLVLTDFEYVKKGSIAKFTVTNETDKNITFNGCIGIVKRNNKTIQGGISFSIFIGDGRGSRRARLNGNTMKQIKNCHVILKSSESYTIEIPIISEIHQRNIDFYSFTHFFVAIRFKYQYGDIKDVFSSSSEQISL